MLSGTEDLRLDPDPHPLPNIRNLDKLCPGICELCPGKRVICFNCPGIVLEISTLMSWKCSRNVLECPGMSWNLDFRIVWPLCNGGSPGV